MEVILGSITSQFEVLVASFLSKKGTLLCSTSMGEIT
jgi:hypothetical protein